MATLSSEVNRFLGYALLDPEMARRIFNSDRAATLKDFNLLPEERATILASKARSLPELSRELVAALATSTPCDAEAEMDALRHSLRPRGHSISVRRVQGIARRVINGENAGSLAHAQHPATEQNENYACLKTA